MPRERVGDILPTFVLPSSVRALQGAINGDFTSVRAALQKCADAGTFKDGTPDWRFIAALDRGGVRRRVDRDAADGGCFPVLQRRAGAVAVVALALYLAIAAALLAIGFAGIGHGYIEAWNEAGIALAMALTWPIWAVVLAVVLVVHQVRPTAR